MNRTIQGSIAVLGLQLCMLGPVHANNEALARAQFMLRQMSAEKTQLLAENKSLAADKKQLQDRLGELDKKFKKLSRKSEKSSTALTGRIETLRAKLEDLSANHGETNSQLQQMTGKKNRLQEIATEQTAVIDLCVANNKKLYDINQKLLGKYEDKGVWSALSQAEPFTGLKQVEIENLVDDYQYRLDDLRVEVPEVESNPSLLMR